MSKIPKRSRVGSHTTTFFSVSPHILNNRYKPATLANLTRSWSSCGNRQPDKNLRHVVWHILQYQGNQRDLLLNIPAILTDQGQELGCLGYNKFLGHVSTIYQGFPTMLRLRCLLPLVMALLLCMVGESFAQQGGFGKGNPPPNQMPKGQAEAAAGMAIGFLVCIGVSVVAGIALKIFIILFIVKDAKKRGMDPTMWVILEIFVGLVGLIVYLCVREPLLSERRRRQYDDDEDDGHDDLIRRRR